MADLGLWEKVGSFRAFVVKWLSHHYRSLLGLLLGVLLPLQIFIFLAIQIRSLEGGWFWDEAILRSIHSMDDPLFDRLAVSVTNLGTRLGVFPLSLLLLFRFLVMRRWRSLLYLALALGGSLLINRSAKLVMHRLRPHLWDSFYPPDLEYAFPSGHAMSSMTFVAALVMLTWGSRWCGLLLLAGGFFVGAIAWTRLYLGVHYPSDILAGWLVSIAWTVGLGLLLKPDAIADTPVALAVEQSAESTGEPLTKP